MTRYNIFNLIHKALRVMLYETAINLQQTDFAVKEEASEAFEKIEAVLEAFGQHGFHEDESVTPEEKAIAGSAINIEYRNFKIFNLQHMQREETDLNPLLWENYSDQEIKEINALIVSAINPENMMTYATWFMRSVNSHEASEWLTEMKLKAPAAVFEKVFALTETCMPEHIRNKVQQKVSAVSNVQTVM